MRYIKKKIEKKELIRAKNNKFLNYQAKLYITKNKIILKVNTSVIKMIYKKDKITLKKYFKEVGIV